MAKVVGLTGGIGSGKSTIARYMAALGIPVYIADEEAKKILFLPDTVAAVKAAFGEAVLTDGIPDRKKLSAVVFKDADKLQELNAIIHPAVQKHFEQWVANHSSVPFVVKEAAILFESGSYKDCDKIILVTAPVEVRIKRVIERDNTTREQVQERISNQWDDEKKEKLSDYVIHNTDLELAKQEVNKIVKELEKI